MHEALMSTSPRFLSRDQLPYSVSVVVGVGLRGQQYTSEAQAHSEVLVIKLVQELARIGYPLRAADSPQVSGARIPPTRREQADIGRTLVL